MYVIYAYCIAKMIRLFYINVLFFREGAETLPYILSHQPFCNTIMPPLPKGRGTTIVVEGLYLTHIV